MPRFRLVFAHLEIFPPSEIVTDIPLGPKDREASKSSTDLTRQPTPFSD
jgi:hypothetical protein